MTATQLYYDWIRADKAWHEELVNQFKGRAGDMRYIPAGKGEKGSLLRQLYNAWVKAGNTYWDALGKTENKGEEAQFSFDTAIRLGVLSEDINDRRFAGNYMFMGRDAQGLAFKNIITRQYVHCRVAVAS